MHEKKQKAWKVFIFWISQEKERKKVISHIQTKSKLSDTLFSTREESNIVMKILSLAYFC